MEKLKTTKNNRFENIIKFTRRNGRYNDKKQGTNILNRHKHRLIRGKGHRNKYRCERWINDSRGCGWGCIVSKKRFTY